MFVTPPTKSLRKSKSPESASVESAMPSTNAKSESSANTGETSIKNDTTFVLSETVRENPPKLKPRAVLSQQSIATSHHKTQLSQEGSVAARRASFESAGSPSLPPSKPKYVTRKAEAKACLVKAKTLLGESRNLKADIKTGVTQAIDRLYRLVIEVGETKEQPVSCLPTGTQVRDERAEEGTTQAAQMELMKELIKNIKEHNEALTECKKHTIALSAEFEQIPKSVTKEQLSYAEVTKLSETIADLRKDFRSFTLPRPEDTLPSQRVTKVNKTPLHSVIVTSNVKEDTSQELIAKIRNAVDATNTGIRVDRLRKAKDQKIIIGCHSRDEMARVSDAIKAGDLQVKEAQNRDPLIIVRDVLALHTDEEVVKALKKQNRHLLSDIEDQEARVTVRYRRKTRNPHTTHLVMQVSPVIWQRLTAAGCVHIDLQRLKVEDQSPLVQCSLCLGYGHSRRLCKDTVEKCSHCGGPHRWMECEKRFAGIAPTCCNCSLAKFAVNDHSAFNQECPIRRKWDALARATTAYC